eukprot:4023677-Pleurochrysis_carterae.AAC.1
MAAQAAPPQAGLSTRLRTASTSFAGGGVAASAAMAAIVVSGWRTIASAARAPAADDSVLTAVSFATQPGGRSRSVLGAAAGGCAVSVRVVSTLAAGASLARAPVCATSISCPAASSQSPDGPSSRSWLSAPASATSSRQFVAAACVASLEPAAAGR